MSERGFTLLEVVVAMGMLAVLLVGVVPAFFVMLDTNTRNEQRAGAVAAGQQILEVMRQQSPSSMPVSGTVAPDVVSIDDRDYEVTRWFCLDSQFCGTDSRHVLIEVKYGGRRLFSAESVYTQLN